MQHHWGSEEYRIGTPVPRKYLPAVRPNLMKVTIGLIEESAFDKCSVRSLDAFLFWLKTVEFSLPFSHPTLRRHRCFILWLEAPPHLSLFILKYVALSPENYRAEKCYNLENS